MSQNKALWRPRLLLISVFLAVGSGVVYELLIAATSAHLWGDSIYQFSLTIGLFMSAMGVGSYLTQKLDTALVDALVWVLLLMAFCGGLTFVVLRLSDLYTASYLAVAHGWTVILGALVGVSLPLAVRIIERDWPVKRLLAQVLFVDYVGALFGSLALPWFLLPRLGFAKGSVFVAGVCILSCILLLIGFGRECRSLGRNLAGVGFVCVTLVVGWFGSEAMLHKLVSAHNKGVKEVYVVRSPYQEIRFVQYDKSQFLFLNRQPQFSSQDERRYHETLVHPPMALSASRRRVLLLGGGDGLAMREIWKYHDVKDVVMVDLDPMMTGFGTKHPVMSKMNEGSMRYKKHTRHYCVWDRVCGGRRVGVLFETLVSSPKASCPAWRPIRQLTKGCVSTLRRVSQEQTFEVVNRDAWKYIEESKKPFTVIISDLPDATNISLSKLYSVEFYRLLRRQLTKDGVMAVQSTAIMPGYQKTFWCILHTVGAAGFWTKGYQAWVPSFGVHTSYTLAANGPLRAMSMKVRVPTAFLNRDMLPALFWFPKDIREVKTRINRIDTHILLRYLLRGR